MKDYFLIRYLFNTFIILFKFFNFIFQGLSSIILFHKKGLTTKFLMTRPINRWLCTSNEENVYFVGTSNFSFILQNQPNYYLSSCAFPKFVLNNFKKFWTFSCLERDNYKVLIERKMKILLNIYFSLYSKFNFNFPNRCLQVHIIKLRQMLDFDTHTLHYTLYSEWICRKYVRFYLQTWQHPLFLHPYDNLRL